MVSGAVFSQVFVPPTSNLLQVMDDSGVSYLTGDQRKVYLTVLRLCFDFIKLVRLVIRLIYENMIIAFLF